jgi:hypothetical protein
MSAKDENKKRSKVGIFFKGLVEKLDKKIKDKVKDSSCCCDSSKKGNNSCCS